MEREPQHPKRYVIEYDGTRYELAPTNTIIYLHTDQPTIDHFYVQFEDDGEEVKGHFGWREKYEKFDEMIQNLIQIGCSQVIKTLPTQFDLEQYKERFGHLPQATQPQEAPELKYNPLTPRQERMASFLGYLLNREHLNADDFRGDGALYI
jgi:hypothetical protein